MARGWESKAVEQQVEDANNPQTATVSADSVTPPIEDGERKHRQDSLKLVRSQVSEQLKHARSVSQRQMLHQRLKAIDTDLAALG